MKKTLSIEGMSCGHCTATVEKALRALSGVSDVKVDLASKTAVVTAADTVDESSLVDAVNDTGFEVVKVD